MTVFVPSRNAQHLGLIFCLSGQHHLSITFPVAGAKALGNYKVEGLAEGFIGGEAKYPLRRGIPKNNLAIGAGGDDRIAGRLGESLQIEP